MGYGKLIAFEGPDVAGKSTVIKRLKIVLPTIFENEKFLFTREPGNLLSDNNECEKIREDILNNKKNTEEQSKLFAKSRLIHTDDIIKKLKEGYNVITDRYILSSLYYQGLIIGYDKVFNDNKKVIDLLNKEKIKLNNVIFKISTDTYNKRMALRDEAKDAIEDVEKETILNRIEAYNSATSVDELKHINNNKVYIIDSNGVDYDRILIDTLEIINKILKED